MNIFDSFFRKNRAKMVWEALFPLKVGDRVRVLERFGSDKEERKKVLSQTATIATVIEEANANPYIYWLKFDDPKLQEELHVHVFSRKELQVLGKE